jgi:uncharacterized phage protein gp47/JayE
MFQIKDFASITAGALNYLSATQAKITDFNVGSVARTIVEAVAGFVEELYLRMLTGLLDAQTASTYKSFLFDALPAAGSTGTVRFGRNSAASARILIPDGARVGNQDATLTWAVTGTGGAIEIGETYVDLAVLSTTTGAATNVAAGVINQLVDSIAGVEWVENRASFVSGRDIESDSARQARFHAMIATLARGVLPAIEYGAKTAQVVSVDGVIQESVVEVKAYEPYIIDPDAFPVGYVEVFIHSGGLVSASAELVARAQQIVDGYYQDDGTPVVGWKAAGVVATVSAASVQPVPVVGVLTISPGYAFAEVRAAVVASIGDYIGTLQIGQELIAADVITAAMNVPGVYNFVISAPSADVVAASSRGHKVVPGAFTVSPPA